MEQLCLAARLNIPLELNLWGLRASRTSPGARHIAKACGSTSSPGSTRTGELLLSRGPRAVPEFVAAYSLTLKKGLRCGR